MRLNARRCFPTEGIRNTLKEATEKEEPGPSVDPAPEVSSKFWLPRHRDEDG
jgi:hypothetical protein